MSADEQGISEEFARDGDLIDFMERGQEAYDQLSPDEDSYESVQGIQIEEEQDEAIDEVYPRAADDMDVYRWEMGEGQEDEYFVLDEETESIDQENAFRSRVIHSENARYQLVQEKEEGDLKVEMYVEGDPMFSIENHGDFEDLWSRIQGNEAEIGYDSRLDSDYSAQSDQLGR